MEALGTTAAGEPLAIDLDRLIGSHACVVANSGGGKSGLIRRLLETTHGRIQHIVLDVEDEFYTLRQRFDYVIAGGDGGDAPASPSNAAQLARAALEHGFSLIAQLNDLGADGAPEFVGAFLEGLMQAPRSLWRPVLVVIDETQRFAPRLGETSATAGVKDLLARGRKRGFTALLASQSLPEIDPRVRGLTNNWLLGRAGTALDRKTVAAELGFAPSSPEARGLASLQREFWAFGPAISPEPVLVRVADVETPMPRPGEAKVPTPPPAEALAGILAGLTAPATDTAPEVERQASADEISKADRAGYARGLEDGERRGEARGVALGIARAQQALVGLSTSLPEPGPVSAPETIMVSSPAPRAVRPAPNGAGTPSRAVQAIISTLEAAWPRALTFVTAAKHAGVGLRSSQFRTYEPELRATGRAEQVDGKWRALVSAPLGVSLLDAAAAKLSPAQARILSALRSAPTPLAKDEIAVAAGVSITSSTTGATLSTLADMDLTERTSDGRYQLAEAFRA